MKTKDFDCVEMKRRGAEVLYKKLKTMTPEEQLAYWKASTEELKQMQRTTKSRMRSEVNSNK